jgi:thioredoxin 1
MKTSFKQLLDSSIPVLIDFHADWCGPCKTLAPIIKQVKDVLGEEIKIIKIDVDKNPSIAAQYQVKGVPTLILFKAQQQVWRQSGVLQKHELLQALQPFL